MENLDIFTESLLNDKVRLLPSQLSNNLREVISVILKSRHEGKCSKNGYIRPGSLEVLKISPGSLRMVSLNGDVIFNVQCKAQVCNPAIGTVVKALITNTNKFGILAEVGITTVDPDSLSDATIPVLEVIITKQGIGIAGTVNLEKLRVGDTINVEILGKKFELNDTKVSAIGKVVEDETKKVQTEIVEDEGIEDGVEVEEDEDVLDEEDDDVIEEEDDELDGGGSEGSLLSFDDDDILSAELDDVDDNGEGSVLGESDSEI